MISSVLSKFTNFWDRLPQVGFEEGKLKTLYGQFPTSKRTKTLILGRFTDEIEDVFSELSAMRIVQLVRGEEVHWDIPNSEYVLPEIFVVDVTLAEAKRVDVLISKNRGGYRLLQSCNTDYQLGKAIDYFGWRTGPPIDRPLPRGEMWGWPIFYKRPLRIIDAVTGKELDPPCPVCLDRCNGRCSPPS